MKHLKPINKKAQKIEETITSVEEDVVALQQQLGGDAAREHERGEPLGPAPAAGRVWADGGVYGPQGRGGRRGARTCRTSCLG